MTLVSMPAKAHGGALKNILWVVIHSMETDITDGIAEALSGPSWFGGSAAGTSPHQCFDSFGPGVRNLPDTVVAYHAGPTGNTYGLAKEHAGRASFTRAQWTTPKGLAMLRASAAQTAIDCLAHGIPARWLSLVQVAGRKEKGLVTHNDLRLAFPADTTHSDVGPNFPFDLYLQLVQAEIARLTGTAPAAQPITQEDDMPNYLDWRQQDKEALVSDIWKGLGIHPRSGVAGDDGKETSPLDQLLDVAARASKLPSAGDVINGLLDTPIDRTDVGRGPTTLRAILVWSDNHVDSLASAIAAAASAGPVDAAAVRQLVQDAVNSIDVKITAG